MARRERPHLVFDADGNPLGLTNGVTPSAPCDEPDNCPSDYSFTGFQFLSTGSKTAAVLGKAAAVAAPAAAWRAERKMEVEEEAYL